MPAIVFTDTYVWNNATVTATVDDNAPGYSGLYHWNYHVRNDSFASGIAAFAVPVEQPGMASNLGSNVGWIGSPDGFMGDQSLVSWEAGAQPALTIGQSADFWFTTAPTALAITAGFVADPGLATTPGGLLVTAMAAPPGLPQAPPPGQLVTTNLDVVDDFDRWFSLREAVNYVNGLLNQPQQRVAFTATLSGATITLDPTKGQLNLEQAIFIDGPASRITIQRDSGSAVKHRIFDVQTNVIAMLADLNLRNGELDLDAGGAVRSQGIRLTVENCTFTNNKAVGSRGGAIAALSGSFFVTGSVFTGNSATSGGAIYVGERVSTPISSSSLVLNTAVSSGVAANGYGGGIYIDSSTTAAPTFVTLTGVDVNGNSAAQLGGGIYVHNPGGAGAGTTLRLDGGTTVRNNQVTSTTGKGGGVYFGKGELILGGATIADNTATTGRSIYRVTGTMPPTIVPGTTNIYEDVFGP